MVRRPTHRDFKERSVVLAVRLVSCEPRASGKILLNGILGGGGWWAATAAYRPMAASFATPGRTKDVDLQAAAVRVVRWVREGGRRDPLDCSLEGGERAAEQTDTGPVPRCGDLDHQELAS